MPKGVYSIEGRRKVWTAEDRFEVEGGIALGKTYAQIAKRLGRSEASVKVYCSRNVRVLTLRPLSARAVAALLGLSCAKTVARWAELGWLPGRRSSVGAGANRRWQFDEESVHAFMENREHWHRWDASRIPDSDLREWAMEIRTERFLTHAEVASRYVVERTTVGSWIDRGFLPAARNGNRLIPESALASFVPPSSRDRHGRPHRTFTPAEDARLIALRDSGATWAECEYQLRRSLGSCAGRYARLTAHRQKVAA